MKHNIRQRVINQYGLPVTKIEQVSGELGSGILDKNGKEIFEGDIIKDEQGSSPVTFRDGCLIAFGYPFDDIDGDFEIIGHVVD